jgi:hypothetical protein
LVVDELLSLRGITEGTLVWTRPNFFAFRYELVCSAGPLARLSVNGIGAARYALMETSEESWRLAVFPLERREVPVSRAGGDADPVAIFNRVHPASVQFQGGPLFQFQPQSPVETILSGGDGQTIFTVELVEAFPRWRADLKLEPQALSLPEVPVLLAAACCNLVFE